MTVQRIHGDMLEVGSQVADGSVDFLFTDLPYNISEGGAKPVWIDKTTGEDKSTIHSQKFSENFDQDWDAVGHEEFLQQLNDWSEVWFKQLRKGGTFAIFISDQYISYLWKIMESKGFEPKRVWTWKKPAAVPFNRGVNPVSGCEYLLWGIKPGGKRTFNSDTPIGSYVERYALADKMSSMLYKAVANDLGTKTIDDIFKQVLEDSRELYDARKTTNGLFNAVVPNTITYSGGLGKNKIHPTEKPVEMLKFFIELCSNKGDLVLDTFAGSGSCGVACEALDRNCILIERDTKMFAKMNEKFTRSDLTNNLFD